MPKKNDAVAEMFVELRGDVTKLKNDIRNLEKTTKKETKQIEENFSSTFKRIGKNTAAFFGITSAVAILTRSVSRMIDVFRGFDREMANVNTIIGVSNQRLDAMKTSLRSLSREVGADATQLAQGLYQATSAGIGAGNAIEFMTTAAKAAKAGLSTVKTSVDGITTVINAWHLSATDATKVSDIMFQTVKLGKTTFEELASSISIVANLAASAGVSFEEVSGAFASLTKQGVPTSVAATQIRAAIIALNDELGDGWSNTYTLTEAMEQLRAKANYSNTVLKEMVGRIEGVNGILGLTGKNAQVAADDFDAMKNALGASNKAFAEQTKSLDFQINKLGSIVSDVFIRTMNNALPIITGLGHALEWFGNVLAPVEDALNKERVAMVIAAKQAQTYEQGTQERADRIKELKNQYPKLLEYLDTEKSSNEDLAKAIRDINTLYRERAKAAALEAKMQKIYEDTSDSSDRLYNTQKSLEDQYKSLFNVIDTEGLSFEQMAEAIDDFRNKQAANRGSQITGITNAMKLAQAQKFVADAMDAAADRGAFYAKQLELTNQKIKEMTEVATVATPDDQPVAQDITEPNVVKIKPLVIPLTEEQKEELMLSDEELDKRYKKQGAKAEAAYFNIGTAAVEGFAASGINTIWHELSEGMRKEAGIVEQIVIGMVDSIISELQRIISVKLITKLAQGPLSFLGIQHGGSIHGTPSGPKRMQSGGSLDVPFGFQNDQYPIMVESGERVDVTTRSKSSSQEALLTNLVNRVEALNANLLQQEQGSTDAVQVNISGEIRGNDIMLAYDKNNRIKGRSG